MQISDVGGELLGNNMFVYCFNNPINMDDSNGNWPKWAKKLAAAVAVVVVVAVVAAVTVATGATIACFAVGAAKGAAVGFVTGAVTGAVEGAVEHRITTGSWDGAGEAALDGMADGALSGSISGAITGGITSNSCFVAGTAILSSTGFVPIESICTGDKVWAENPETGDRALKEVVQTFVNESYELIHISVNGESIVTTPEHPFYAPVKGWTAACKLRAGDILVTVNGEYVVVEKIQHEILESPITVYNFEVADFHTYYVSERAVLVHNLCKPSRITNVTKSESPIWKGLENAKNGLRTSGTGKNLKYYSWDYRHNEIEVFNRLGNHLGAIDPSTGEFVKGAVKGRVLKF